MKKFLTLRNILIFGGAFIALLVFIFSFLAACRFTHGGNWEEYKVIIWGSRTVTASDGSSYTAPADQAIKAAVLPLIGAILVLLGGIGACVVALFGDKFLSEQIKKFVIIGCGGLLVLGGIFTFFTLDGFLTRIAEQAGVTLQQYKDMLNAAGVKVSCALPVISGILAILGGGAMAASQFVPDKQF